MATIPPPNVLAQLLQQGPAGGAPGGGPPGLPGAPAGAPSPGGPGGPPPQMIPGLGAQPSPGGEAAAMKQAMAAIGFAMSRFQMRAPDVARELATALVHVKKAMDKSATMLQTDLGPPPPGIPGGGGMAGAMDAGAMGPGGF